MIKKEYRRHKNSDTWHFCQNCSRWPSNWEDYETWCDTDRPSSGELCDECLAKEKAGKCKYKSCE